MGAMSPGHYVIVARHRPDVLQRTRARFADHPLVDVIVDRRTGERRRRFVVPLAERRIGDRRRPVPESQDLRFHAAVIVPRSAAPDAAAANGEPGALAARVQRWRHETEWLLTELVPEVLRARPTIVAQAAEIERLREDNAAMRRERAELAHDLGVAMTRLTEILRTLPVDCRPASGPRAGG